MKQLLADRMQGIPLSGIREIFEKAQSIPDVIRLEFGEPDFDTPAHIKEAAQKALDEGRTKYTSSFGIPELRKAIAEKMVAENNVKCSLNNTVVTTGAISGLLLSIMATVNPGGEVLIPDPGWSSNITITRMAGAVPIGYPIREGNEFQLELEGVKKLITPRTRMILINSPNNPTGGVISAESLKAVGELALEHDLLILTDEVYEKFVYDGEEHVSIGSFPDFRDNVITVNSFSKTYAMTGWRLGYVVAPDPIAEAVGRLNGSSNSCAAAMTQVAGLAALKGPQHPVSEMIRIFEKRRNIVLDELSGIKGLGCRPPRGAFYAFVNITRTGYTSMDLAMKLLVEGHVATVPGSAFGVNGEGYLRLAYTNSEEKLKEAASRMKRVLAS